jgi:hypothetical protein
MADCRSAYEREDAMIPETGSAEAVAYALFERVCYAEGKDIGLTPNVPAAGERPSRNWIFSTYAECLGAVRSPGQFGAKSGIETRFDPSGHRHVSREAILASDPI